MGDESRTSAFTAGIGDPGLTRAVGMFTPDVLPAVRHDRDMIVEHYGSDDEVTTESIPGEDRQTS